MLTALSMARFLSSRFILQEVFVYCGYLYTKQCHNGNKIITATLNEHKACIALKICFLLSALQMCCACAITLMLALFKYEKKKELASINNIKPLASETQCNQAFEG